MAASSDRSLDLAYGVHHRGVVAVAEPPPDLRQGPRGQLLGQVHGDLPWTRHGACPAGREHFAELDVEVLGDLLLNLFDGHPAVVGLEQVMEHVLHHLQRHRTADQDCMRLDPVQRAFELADVRGNLVGQEFEHLRRDFQRDALGLGLQDRQPQFVVGRVDVGDQTPAQPRLQPVFQTFEIARRLVGRNHHLVVLVNQRVEGMEELFLAGFLATNEVDVVDHQHVDRTELVLERDGVAMAHCLNEQRHELLSRQVSDPTLRLGFANVPGDGVH